MFLKKYRGYTKRLINESIEKKGYAITLSRDTVSEDFVGYFFEVIIKKQEGIYYIRKHDWHTIQYYVVLNNGDKCHGQHDFHTKYTLEDILELPERISFRVVKIVNEQSENNHIRLQIIKRLTDKKISDETLIKILRLLD